MRIKAFPTRRTSGLRGGRDRIPHASCTGKDVADQHSDQRNKISHEHTRRFHASRSFRRRRSRTPLVSGRSSGILAARFYRLAHDTTYLIGEPVAKKRARTYRVDGTAADSRTGCGQGGSRTNCLGSPRRLVARAGWGTRRSPVCPSRRTSSHGCPWREWMMDAEFRGWLAVVGVVGVLEPGRTLVLMCRERLSLLGGGTGVEVGGAGGARMPVLRSLEPRAASQSRRARRTERAHARDDAWRGCSDGRWTNCQGWMGRRRQGGARRSGSVAGVYCQPRSKRSPQPGALWVAACVQMTAYAPTRVGRDGAWWTWRGTW